jgi:ERCC4-related helicase
MDDKDIDDLTLDDFDIPDDILANKMKQIKFELSIDKKDFEDKLFDILENFLKYQKNYVLIGGKAIAGYINIQKLDKQARILIESFDYDFKIIGTNKDRLKFINALTDYCKTSLKKFGFDGIQFFTNELKNFDIIQLGYEIGNTVKFFADFHITPSFDNIVKINNINYPGIPWLITEILNTLTEESMIKSWKRLTRKEILEKALKNNHLFKKEFLKMLCNRCFNKQNIDYIVGKSYSCEDFQCN